MVIGDLSDYSFYALFQQELKVELSLLQEALVNLRKKTDEQDSLRMMILSFSAIYGSVRLIDLEEIENLTKSFTDFLKAVEKKGNLLEEHLDLLLEGIKVLLDLYVSDEKKIEQWIEENSDKVKKIVFQIEDFFSKEDEKVSQEIAAETKAESFSEDLLWKCFCQELLKQTKVLEEALLLMEKGEKKGSLMDSCMCSLHSIKGAAKVISSDEIASLCHICEECIGNRLQSDKFLTSEQFELYFECVDLFSFFAQSSFESFRHWMRENSFKLEVLEKSLLESSLKKSASSEENSLEAKEAKASISFPLEKEKEVLKVSTKNIDSIVALSGESFVSSHGIKAFYSNLERLKKYHEHFFSLYQEINAIFSSTADKKDFTFLSNEFQETYRKVQRLLEKSMEEFQNFSQKTANIGERLYRTAISCRMRPFIEGIGEFPRLVRDLAKQLNKEVHFSIKGEETQIDRDVLEKLKSPINHLLRNAVSHGVETPEERKALGKSQESSICLLARYRGEDLIVEVSDDGKGMDLEKMRLKAVKEGFVSLEESLRFTEKELYELLFQPGFSTEEKTSEVSGRGVGMTVAYRVVQEIGGKVNIYSSPREGTTCSLTLPLTQSVLRALIVNVSGVKYAFPLSKINHLMMFSSDKIEKEGEESYIFLDRERVRLIYMADLFGEKRKREVQEFFPVILFREGSRARAFVVDKILGERELIVRNLREPLRKASYADSVAIMEDSTPLLIIDVKGILENEKSRL